MAWVAPPSWPPFLRALDGAHEGARALQQHVQLLRAALQTWDLSRLCAACLWLDRVVMLNAPRAPDPVQCKRAPGRARCRSTQSLYTQRAGNDSTQDAVAGRGEKSTESSNAPQRRQCRAQQCCPSGSRAASALWPRTAPCTARCCPACSCCRPAGSRVAGSCRRRCAAARAGSWRPSRRRAARATPQSAPQATAA